MLIVLGMASGEKGAFVAIFSHPDPHAQTDAPRYTCRYRSAFKCAANVDTACAHVSGSCQTKQSKAKLPHLPNNYFLPLFLGVCISKRGVLKLLYPYKSPPILFPLVLSPHISYQPPSSNSLYLPYCRSLSAFTLLHLPSHLSFLYPCFFLTNLFSPSLSSSLVISLLP